MSDVNLPVDFTVDERKEAWGLIYELFDMAPIDPTDQWKLAALLLRARALAPKQAAAEEMFEALEVAAITLEAYRDALYSAGADAMPTLEATLVVIKAALAKAGQP